ncbi:MAG: hypothetical protein R6U98_35620 [Pirellulaceae bacterium]
MIANMQTTLRWSLSLGAKFVRVVPLYTLAIVFLTLISQIATLLAFFLPLKVVIILASEGTPSYFPPFLAELGRNAVIGLLSAGTAAFFLLHLLAESLISWTTDRGTRRLLTKSRKMVVFEHQDEVAASAYQRYSRALAGGIFIALSLLGLARFYPAMTVILIGYGILTLAVFVMLHGTCPAFRERLESRLLPTLNLAGGIGFFVAFGYLVMDFTLWGASGVIIAIVSLLLSRQVMLRATALINDLAVLQGQRTKLDVLFFHGKVLLSPENPLSKTLWPLLDPQQREKWVAPVLAAVLATAPDRIRSEWHQLGAPNIAGLKVWANDNSYLLKLFEVNRSSLAMHEATLMEAAATALPALPWIGRTRVQQFHCLVYALPGGAPPTLSEARKCTITTWARLIAVEPPAALVQRYQRSKPMIWQRLDAPTLSRLHVAANTPEEYGQVQAFFAQRPALKQELRTMPLVIINPDVSTDSLWLLDSGEPVIKNWWGWSLEPVGSGWPEQAQHLERLGAALQEATKTRASLASILPERAELASLTFALERACIRQRYADAVALLPSLLRRLDILKAASEGKRRR